MVIGLITIVSALHDLASIENSHYELINDLKKNFTVRFITPSEAEFVDIPLIFIASGGTEEMFQNVYRELPKPIILLTDGLHNSLAASMEIQTWIKGLGEKSEILHGSIDYIKAKIEKLHSFKEAVRKLQKSSIGVIGFPSSWLIASDVDYIKAKEKWGVTFRNIELTDFYNRIEKVSQDIAKNVARDFIDNSAGCKEATDENILEAAVVYLALRDLALDNGLNALTLKCFDLIDRIKTSGCLALSLLNDEGLVAGCEGDIQAIFSMYLLKVLTGQATFMTNPSLIDVDKNEVILAHCTIATSMVEKYTIRSHFESRLSVGIQGKMKNEDITVFKVGGSDLNEYFVSKGQILDNPDSANRCRTQIRVKMEKDVDYFLKNPIANHHIVLKGDYEDYISDFMYKMGCRRVI
ncbi:MAG: fucose isomerase [Clostridiales bacterium]|nr:fucose isomerase [Clostridiales bacterium]